MAARKPRNTKKAERAALAKSRRRVRRKMSAKQAAKRSGPREKASHPHRRSSSINRRRG